MVRNNRPFFAIYASRLVYAIGLNPAGVNAPSEGSFSIIFLPESIPIPIIPDFDHHDYTINKKNACIPGLAFFLTVENGIPYDNLFQL